MPRASIVFECIKCHRVLCAPYGFESCDARCAHCNETIHIPECSDLSIGTDRPFKAVLPKITKNITAQQLKKDLVIRKFKYGLLLGIICIGLSGLILPRLFVLWRIPSDTFDYVTSEGNKGHNPADAIAFLQGKNTNKPNDTKTRINEITPPCAILGGLIGVILGVLLANEGWSREQNGFVFSLIALPGRLEKPPYEADIHLLVINMNNSDNIFPKMLSGLFSIKRAPINDARVWTTLSEKLTVLELDSEQLVIPSGASKEFLVTKVVAPKERVSLECSGKFDNYGILSVRLSVWPT